MKNPHRLLTLLLMASLITACGGGNDKKATEVPEDSTEAPYSWEAVLNDSTGRLEMKKREDEFPDTSSVAAVLAFINTRYPQILIEFERQSGDTLFSFIPDAHYLTQQMGSTGPTMYLAELVYNLTELPGIRQVYVRFEEGDHAQPGLFSRDSFRDQ
jgi:hypothetical protein